MSSLSGFADGTVLGTDFEIVCEVGRGSFGTVYRARVLADDTFVAVKALHDASGKDRFRREVQLWSKLGPHPHVVRLRRELSSDLARDGEPTFWFAMDFIDGVSLAKLSNGRLPLPVEEVIDAASDIANGLAHAHDRGVVHRDLKPANVLLDDDDRCYKLTDFGLAYSDQASRKLTAAGDFVGTFEFASPEQFEGRDPTGASDVYGLGATMYLLLTGNPPFGRGYLDVHRNLQRGEAPDVRATNPTVPDGVAELIARAIARNPEERPSAASLRISLMRLVAHVG